MDVRLNKESLISTLRQWNRFFKKKVHLIACGGTAMTLLNIKESTKDVDFMVPDASEYAYFTKILQEIGYKQSGFRWKRDEEMIVFDIYPGKRIHTTELLESPLKEGNHIFIENVGKLYVGILNFYDLISSKLFRGSSVDYEDCLLLVKVKADQINKEALVSRYEELASYDVAEERVKGHLESFLLKWDKAVKTNG